MKLILTLFMALTLNVSIAKADTVVEEAGANAIFLLDGKQVSPVDAAHAADTKGAKIQRCTQIKDAMTGDGKPAYRCKEVIKRINPKNGNTTWKNK